MSCYNWLYFCLDRSLISLISIELLSARCIGFPTLIRLSCVLFLSFFIWKITFTDFHILNLFVFYMMNTLDGDEWCFYVFLDSVYKYFIDYVYIKVQEAIGLKLSCFWVLKWFRYQGYNSILKWIWQYYFIFYFVESMGIIGIKFSSIVWGDLY